MVGCGRSAKTPDCGWLEGTPQARTDLKSAIPEVCNDDFAFFVNCSVARPTVAGLWPHALLLTPAFSLCTLAGC